MTFPKNFLWGAATSSHQVEGWNIHNDWWQWEKVGKVKTSSGVATRHYELFAKDFQAAANLYHNSHRLSIEWSRIQPQKDFFDEEEIHHYQSVLLSLRQHHLEPIVTLHHFTTPAWLSKEGGWLNPKVSLYFARYAEKMVMALGREVKYWVTVNEPEVFTYQGYLKGIWPPGEQSFRKAWRVLNNLVRAHQSAFTKIHRLYRRNQWMEPYVSVAKNIMVFKPCPLSKNPLRYISIFLRNHFFNNVFLAKIKGYMNFIGLNYYAREFVSMDKALGGGLIGSKCNKVHGHVKRVNVMGWDSYPQGLFEVLCYLKRYQLPILITENGTCEEDDTLRWQFIYDHLKQIEKAIHRRIPVIGYLYWSLLDNFEWERGFEPRFGLLEVDYKTYQRKPRPSALKFAEVCRLNTLP